MTMEIRKRYSVIPFSRDYKLGLHNLLIIRVFLALEKLRKVFPPHPPFKAFNTLGVVDSFFPALHASKITEIPETVKFSYQHTKAQCAL